MSPKTKKRPKLERESVRGQLSGAWECLDMVRTALERCGLPMQGCAPMFYDDAVCQLASILGRAAGMERWVDVQRFVAEHEAQRVENERGTILERVSVPAPQEPE